MSKMRFRPSMSDQRRASKSSCDFYAAISGKDTPPEQKAIQATVRDKVARGPRPPRPPNSGDSEATVQKNIIAMLVKHPRVQLVIRTNSGAVNSGGYYVEFNHVFLPHRFRVPWPGVTPEMLISDLQVLLTDGIWMAVECKEEGWAQSQGEGAKAVRERGQAAYLAHVRACGGIGIFATCVGDVEGVLNGPV